MKILFLQKRILFPTDAGNKVRTLNVIRHLAKWHEVTYLCNIQKEEEQYIQEMQSLGVRLETIPWTETPRDSAGFYRDLALNLFSRYPFNVNKDFDPRLRRKAEELLAQEPYDLVICDFVQMARNAIGLNTPASVLFQHNVEAEIFKRHAETDHGWLRRKYMAVQWKKMHKFESEAGRHFNSVIAVSKRDRDIYQKEYGWDHTEVIDTAVNTEYFHPSVEEEKKDHVVFVGSLDWLPNEDGILHFVQNTWPQIRQKRPNATLQIVGRNPGKTVQQLTATSGVEVVGTVPDVRPYLASASVVIVPLRIGGGTRLKIFEALAMKKALVSTSLGAEGLNVTHGEHVLLGDTPEEFSECVLQLLDNDEMRNTLADNAHRLVNEHYTAEAVARQFDEICQKTVASRDPRSTSVATNI